MDVKFMFSFPQLSASVSILTIEIRPTLLISDIVPDSCKAILVQFALPKHLMHSLSTNKSGRLNIPSPKDLIIILSPHLEQCPWDLRHDVPSSSSSRSNH